MAAENQNSLFQTIMPIEFCYCTPELCYVKWNKSTKIIVVVSN